MKFIDKETLENLLHQYPKGTRVELVKMDDPFNTVLQPGSKGTVKQKNRFSVKKTSGGAYRASDGRKRRYRAGAKKDRYEK